MDVNVLPVADAPVAAVAPKTTILEDNSYTFSTADFASSTASVFDPKDTGTLKGSPVHPAGTGDQPEERDHHLRTGQGHLGR